MKTTRFFLFKLLFVTILVWLPQSLAENINIPDANLRAVIAETLGKQPNVPLTRADMARLQRLNAHNRDIEDLTGLEFATNLREIRANNNSIADLSPLAGLSRLDVIELRENVITDLSPLSGLINLRWLIVNGNLISDVSPVADLRLLEGLEISNNAIDDFSALAGLPKLEHIWFSENLSADFLDFGALPSLRTLRTWGTPVINLEGVRAFPKLQRLDICGGEISDLSALEGLTNLTELELAGNEITDISPLSSLTGLKRLNLRHNQITDVSPLAALVNLQSIDLHDNEILDFSPLDVFPETVSILRSENPGSITRRAAPKIVGPWLWIILPTGGVLGSAAAASERDYLSQASGGQVTEQQIATEGAKRSANVGDKVWTVGELSRGDPNNINDMVNATGLGTDNIDFHVAYGSIVLDVTTAQETRFFVGSGDAVKVWLNGKQVHNNAVDRDAEDYQEDFPVTLKQGRNILLVAVYEGEGWWSGFFGLDRNTEYTTSLPDALNLGVLRRPADVDGDGTVGILDMILVARRFGLLLASKTGAVVNEDVNGDGVVNITDLVLVAQDINASVDNDPAAPISPELIQQWIDLAWTEYDGSLAFQKGITSLENILMALTSEKTEPKTALFANYPNPFNPETWIPYQLAAPTEVVLTIRTTTGSIVRTLPLGHHSAGVYKTPNRAAHWDGKNDLGEPVTSGTYFYTLTAGDFTATRKMLIRK